MKDNVIKCIYDREIYNIHYSMMDEWLCSVKRLSIFSYDCGNEEICFSDKFSKYKIKGDKHIVIEQ